MSFLAPLFLIGGLVIAAPILFHLIRRTSRDKKPFSSLMFLEATPPRVTRRSRFEHWLLLLLRCLVVLLLAFGFARPFVNKPIPIGESTTPPKRTLVLVDVSASMQRATLWKEALDKAASVLRSANLNDEVAVMVFDRSARMVVPFEEWAQGEPTKRSELALKKLQNQTPTWAATSLAQALMQGVESIRGAGDGKTAPQVQQIILISDLQQGSRVEALQSYEWPNTIQLVIDPVRGINRSNAGLAPVPESLEADAKAEAEIKVRITNAADSKKEQFHLRWDNSATTVPAYVPAGRSRLFTAPKRDGQRLVLAGDDDPFDNNLYHVALEPSNLQIAYFGKEEAVDSKQMLYYLRRAFPETRRQLVTVVAFSPAQALPPEGLLNSALLVVTDEPSSAQTRAIQEAVENGKIVLVSLQDARLASFLEKALGVSSLGMEEGKVKNYAMLEQIDFQHPIFAAFADPRFSDFTKIHFWKYRKLSAPPNARVLASFDTGDPALIQVAVGKGHYYLLSSGWQPGDSQLALSSKFVPLLFSLLEVSGSLPQNQSQYIIGDPVRLGGVGSALVTRPDGSSQTVTNRIFTQTDLPGIYQVSQDRQTNQFVVNLDPSETRTTALPEDEFMRRGVAVKPVVPIVTPRLERLQGEQLESRQKLWRWFVVGALGLLLLETWLSRRMTVTPLAS